MNRWDAISPEMRIRVMEMSERLVLNDRGSMPMADAADSILALSNYILTRMYPDQEEGK